jgi:hypothetical protein
MIYYEEIIIQERLEVPFDWKLKRMAGKLYAGFLT